jgi:hypothetical protein
VGGPQEIPQHDRPISTRGSHFDPASAIAAPPPRTQPLTPVIHILWIATGHKVWIRRGGARPPPFPIPRPRFPRRGQATDQLEHHDDGGAAHIPFTACGQPLSTIPGTGGLPLPTVLPQLHQHVPPAGDHHPPSARPPPPDTPPAQPLDRTTPAEARTHPSPPGALSVRTQPARPPVTQPPQARIPPMLDARAEAEAAAARPAAGKNPLTTPGTGAVERRKAHG